MDVSKHSPGVSTEVKHRESSGESHICYNSHIYTISLHGHLLAYSPFHRDLCLSCVLGSSHTQGNIMKEVLEGPHSRPEFDIQNLHEAQIMVLCAWNPSRGEVERGWDGFLGLSGQAA